MTVRRKKASVAESVGEEVLLETAADDRGFITVPARIVPAAAGRELDGEGAGEQAGRNRFSFVAEISNTGTDAYHTHMAPSTLRNFARGAGGGVALLDSHSGRRLAVGYSHGGRYEEEGEKGRTVAEFYIVPGIRFGGQHSYASTDDFITAIENEIVRDVSVGFYGGRWVCDVCHSPYYGPGACHHLAGYQYEVETDGRMEHVICTVTIHEAELSEVSLVYDGATPGAMILKVEREAAAGRLSPEMVREIEQQYRVKLPAGVGRDSGVAGADGEETMEEEIRERDETVVTDAETALAETRLALSETTADAALSPADAVRWLNGQLEQVTAERDMAQQEVARLQPLADQGRAYREDLINQTVTEGVRALGEAFPEETYRAMLAGATLEHIRQVRDTFAKQAGERFPGGRQTRDANGKEKREAGERIPAAAYGVRS